MKTSTGEKDGPFDADDKDEFGFGGDIICAFLLA